MNRHRITVDKVKKSTVAPFVYWSEIDKTKISIVKKQNTAKHQTKYDVYNVNYKYDDGKVCKLMFMLNFTKTQAVIDKYYDSGKLWFVIKPTDEFMMSFYQIISLISESVSINYVPPREDIIKIYFKQQSNKSKIHFHNSKRSEKGICTYSNDGELGTNLKTDIPLLFRNINALPDETKPLHVQGKFLAEFRVLVVNNNLYVNLFTSEVEIKYNLSNVSSVIGNNTFVVPVVNKKQNIVEI